jgi:hypothetical protein
MTTETAKHTPGPWTEDGYATIIGADRTVVAAINRTSRVGHARMTEAANRVLIAEAPALLEAAMFALDVLNDLPATGTDANDRDNAISTLEFAIRKATSN